MGRLCIVMGRANTGKSEILIERLHQCMHQGEHGLYIVPEQYTFEAERAIAYAFSGMLGVQVLSFSRLAERILSQSGRTLPFLSKQGRAMVVRRAVYQKQKELIMYSGAAQRPDFANRMDMLISQFKQSGIEPHQLKTALDKLDSDSLLYQKLHDIYIIYQTSESYLASRYLTTNDIQRTARERIKYSFVKDSHVFIDGFDNPSNELYSFFEEMLVHAKSVTITMRQDKESHRGLFEPDSRAMQRICEIAARNGIPVMQRICSKAKGNTALAHLDDLLFSQSLEVFDKQTDEIRIFTLPDRRAEAEHLADMVLERAAQGIRFRDMAVICPDLKLYGSLVKRAFARRNIPLFFDAKRPISGQAATSYLLNSIRAATGGYSVNNVLAVLKSGYSDADEGDIEIFENYLLRYGVYGSSLTAPLTFGEVPDEAERVRLCTMQPLMQLHENLKGTDATKKSQAIIDYLTQTKLNERLTAEANTLMSEGRDAEAQVILQLYPTFEELLNQIGLIMGDSPLSMAEFTALIEEGVAAYQIGSIPSNADQVMLGDLERSKIKKVDSLFLIGCNEGLIPRIPETGTVLNDSELKKMDACGLTVWSDSKMQMQSDRLELYSILTKARNRLYLSFACSAEGAQLSPSPLVERIRKLFPMLRVESNLDEPSSLPSCEQTGFSRLVYEFRMFGQEGTHTQLLPALVAVYNNRPAYAQKLRQILDGEARKNSPSPLDYQIAKQLYGQNVRMSASRLETFNKCPFEHMESYGLKAKPRKEAKEEASDIGTLIHDVLDSFVRYVQQEGTDWLEMDSKRSDDIVDKILPECIARHNDGIFLSNVRLRESLFLLEIRIKLACRSITKQVQLGEFRPECTEMNFGLDYPPVKLITDNGTEVELRGLIDRVDSANVEGDKLLRVVDYKLGARKLEPERIQSGETLQLPLYLEAAKALCGQGVAMYYMPLGQPIPDEEQVEDDIHKLYGVTADDSAVATATEKESSDRSAYVKGVKYKDGKAVGATCSRAELEAIVTLAKRVACKTIERMYAGEAEVFPTANSCEYCDFRSVCRFDKQLGNKVRSIPKRSIKELGEGALL